MNPRKFVTAPSRGGGKAAKQATSSKGASKTKNSANVNVTLRKPPQAPSSTSITLPPEFSVSMLKSELEEYVQEMVKAQTLSAIEAAAESVVRAKVEEEARIALEGMLAKMEAVKADLESVKTNELAGTTASIESLRADVESVGDKVGVLTARFDLTEASQAERARAHETLSKKVASFESQLSGVCDRLENFEKLGLVAILHSIEARLSAVEAKAGAANATAKAANATAEECTMQSELRAKRHATDVEQKIAEMIQEKIAAIEEEKRTIKKNRELIKRILSQIGDDISPEVKSLRKEVNTISELFVQKVSVA